MRGPDLWNLLVPGLLFLVWLLNQIFSKEASPAPPRTQGLGPRPGGLPPAPRPARAEPTSAGRFSEVSPASGSERTDDVFVIRSGMTPGRRPPERERGGSRPSSRRGGRGESAKSKPPRVPDPPPSRLVPTGVSQRLDATAPGLGASSAADAELAARPQGDRLAQDIRQALRSPTRIREAFLLNELLQPPVALRPRRHAAGPGSGPAPPTP